MVFFSDPDSVKKKENLNLLCLKISCHFRLLSNAFKISFAMLHGTNLESYCILKNLVLLKS
jgi:hypothetical protein